MLKQQNKWLQEISSKIAEKHDNWKTKYASNFKLQEFENNFSADLGDLKKQFNDRLEEFVEVNAGESPYFKTYKETFKIENDKKIYRDLLSLKEDYLSYQQYKSAKSEID